MILVVNKVDRPDARIEEVVNEVYELFLDLDADESQIEFPIVYTNARTGQAGLQPDELDDDLSPLFDLLLERIPAPEYDPDHPAAGARHEPRRLAVRRPARARHACSTGRSGRASRSPGAAPTGRSSARR